jgi:integrase
MARVFQRGSNWWIDFVDAEGRRKRKKIGPNQRIAKEILSGVLGNVARRVHLGVIEDSAIPFADFVKEWQRRVAPTLKPRSQERWFGIARKHLKPAFPGALRAINLASVENYVARRIEQGAAPSTVNREIAVLKHMFKRAVQWEYLGRFPLTGLAPLKEAPGRARFLSVEEIDRLLAACGADLYLRAFTLVALNTGMRRNEVLGLTRKSIDWQNRVALIGETKNGEARRVYLNETAFSALAGLPVRLDGRLFPFGPNQVSMAFGRIVKRAGIEDFRLHDLRHSFASYQAMAGIQQRGLQALLGHKDPRMTARYTHLSDAYLRGAVDAVNLGAGSQTAVGREKVGTYLAPGAGNALSAARG